MAKPSDAGAWLKTHPRLRVKLAVLSIDEYVLLTKIWLYCQDAGNRGRLHVDELPAACDRLLTPSRISKALAGLHRYTQTHDDGTVTALWLDIDGDHVQMPEWWCKENPGPHVWNDDVLRWRHLRNKELWSPKCADLREKVRHRDRNLCRYCGLRVTWGANNADHGGTHDHVDPDEGNTLSNVVVACRRCNGRKKDRTPEQWIAADPAEGLSLLPQGTTADQVSTVRARAGPPDSSSRVRPKSNHSGSSRARPDRVEPKPNPSRTATDPASTRPIPTAHPHTASTPSR